MALFKIFKGIKSDLPKKCTLGYAYITTDTGEVFFDIESTSTSTSGIRIQLNAKSATKLSATMADGTVKTIEIPDIALKTDIAALQNKVSDVPHGGTGHTTLTLNAVMVGNDTNSIKLIPSDNGAFYADQTNGEPQFGVLPVAQGGTGNATGDSPSATKLTTARNIQTDLGNSNPVSFDGTSDITPGVTGVLPIANGGTGNVNGKAVSADKLETARNVTIDLTTTNAASFDGTADIAPGISGILPIANGGTGNTTGKSPSADKLAIARTIQTDLTSIAAASFDGTADILPGVQGILPIANGGTGNANGSAVKLTNARTISLNQDVTGNVSFDGSSDVSILTTLSNSGVVADTYGPFLNGLCWVSNNHADSTTATWTLTAKKAGTLRFLYVGGGESNYDYLTVSIDGNKIFDTKGKISPYGGYYEKALNINNAIEFKYTKDSSNSHNIDCCGIGNLSLGDNNTAFNVITPDNIDTYFTVTNGTYTFEPMMVFTGASTTVDSKGRITNTANIFPAIYTLTEWQNIVGGGGSSGSADKLTTARTIQTNLASTSAASFDGTANITPGVTGILSISNGGTGNNQGYIRTGRKGTTAIGDRATAEGYDTISSGLYAHAEGESTTASGGGAHAEGSTTKATANSSHAEGSGTVASNLCSHAEGINCTASGKSSHAEGWITESKGQYSHAEGNSSIAEGDYSHAEGISCHANGESSHVEGSGSYAWAECSHAEGKWTSTNNFASHVSGHCNKNPGTGGALNNTTGDAMVIGNGSGVSYRSNCFRVTYAGEVYGLSAFNSSGADYAEYFEWADGNPKGEDRVGYFVTLDGDKIRLAQPGDYVLGVVSGQPCIIGNADEDWLGRWVHDEFGRFVLEYLEDENTEIYTEGLNEEEIEALHADDVKEKDGKFYRITSKVVDYETPSWRYKANPNYDSSQEYIERKDRPEWNAIGMTGILSVRDDGSCQVNSYCTVTNNGIATAADSEFVIIDSQLIKNWRVIQRVSDKVVKVIFK